MRGRIKQNQKLEEGSTWKALIALVVMIGGLMIAATTTAKLPKG